MVNEKITSQGGCVFCPVSAAEQKDAQIQSRGRNQSRPQEDMLHSGDHRQLQQRQCSCLPAGVRAAGGWKASANLTRGADTPRWCSQCHRSPPSASGLFVAEGRAAHFRREANRFRDLPLPALPRAFIKYFREQKAPSKARGLCSRCGWRLESSGLWLPHSLLVFCPPSSMVPINFKTEIQPINVESIKGQRNR